MLFPRLSRFLPVGLLFLRLMVGAVFIDSGSRDLRSPAERSQGISKSKEFTVFLGCAEILGGAGVVVGIWQQLAACGLIIIMIGAICEKAFVWHTGFWGGSSYGWHYDLMLGVMNLVIVFTNGGDYVLMK